MEWTQRHLLGLEYCSAEEIVHVLDTAREFQKIATRNDHPRDDLAGKVVVNLFFEASTRTRMSFELAEKRLGASVVNFSASTSSTRKGETLRDTARNIEAMGIDVAVMRHPCPGAPQLLTRCIDACIVNAGDGSHEHPTQGLLDIFTIREHLGRIEGLKVAIVGDVAHSRVARSNLQGLLKLGAEVYFVGPSTLVYEAFEQLGAHVCHTLDDVLPEMDVIHMLRVQNERLEERPFPSIREYARLFGLNAERLARAKPDVLIMHPGPINRGVEMTPDVADGTHSVILEQVTNGVAIRMAILSLVTRVPGEAAEPKGAAAPAAVQAPPPREPARPRASTDRKLLVKGGRVICPAQGIDRKADVLLEDGKVAAIGTFDEIVATIDAAGMIVTPGLIDMHVHFREPGKEDEETIASGSAAAVAGGFATVATMPNTDPPVDNEAAVAFQLLQGERAGLARVLPIGTVSAGRAGEQLAEIGQMVRAGAVAFSDDGSCVQSARLMRAALQYASMFDKPIIDHCEDASLMGNGMMHGGYWSTRLALSGIPAAAEEIMVARDLTLAEATGGRLHVAHVSTAGSVDLIRRARDRGVPVTCEATVHHLTLTHQWVSTFDPNTKMNPPLRRDEDVEALRAAVADGAIDCIVTDHAPHAPEEKDVEFPYAPFGVIGLESALPILITQLIEPGILTWPQAVAAMTCHPARILGTDTGTLEPGRPADVTLIDPNTQWTIDARGFRSKSRNCPFDGWKVRGRALVTIVGGEIKHDARGEA